MPELPEVEALRVFLHGACVGRTVARTELVAFACLKTFQLPLSALHGLEVDAVTRRDVYKRQAWIRPCLRWARNPTWRWATRWS